MSPIFDTIKKLKKINPLQLSEQIAQSLPPGIPGITSDGARRRVLDILMNLSVPFNRWLGLRLRECSDEKVIVESPAVTLRKNHVGTAHACAQALIGEYAAGLLIAQHFPIEQYRLIIGKLEIDYKKAGKGTLFGTAEAPMEWPEMVDGEAWIEMVTTLTNKAGEEVSICKTRWQVKQWDLVGKTHSTK